jgi:hypothetical protein
MAATQKQFNEFHDTIKLDEEENHTKLRDKRDMLIAELKEGIKDETFTTFHQGSYSLKTGVMPIDGNYDIDIGILFACEESKYSPVQLKKKVHDALTRHNRVVIIRRPCVTVNYIKDGKTDYHVDLAVYINKANSSIYRIAMGKANSKPENIVWQDANPKDLTKTINEKFGGDDAAQFRRCVRYLKRWRDNKFSDSGPISISLTVLAYKLFAPSKSMSDDKYIDLQALIKLTDKIKSTFYSRYSITENKMLYSTEVKLHVEPNNDLLERMTDIQKNTFYEKICELSTALQDASDESLPEEACKILRKQFGDAFPIPTKDETAKRVDAPFVSTGSSAY